MISVRLAYDLGEVDSWRRALFLLQELLSQHPWYAEPLEIAASRARKHLNNERLRVEGAGRCSETAIRCTLSATLT